MMRVTPTAASLPRSLGLPTDEERIADQLHRRQGLNDTEITEILGITRETVNRRRARYAAKARALIAATGLDANALLDVEGGTLTAVS